MAEGMLNTYEFMKNIAARGLSKQVRNPGDYVGPADVREVWGSKTADHGFC